MAATPEAKPESVRGARIAPFQQEKFMSETNPVGATASAELAALLQAVSDVLTAAELCYTSPRAPFDVGIRARLRNDLAVAVAALQDGTCDAYWARMATPVMRTEALSAVQSAAAELQKTTHLTTPGAVC